MRLICVALLAALGFLQAPELTATSIDDTVSAVATLIAAEYFDGPIAKRVVDALNDKRNSLVIAKTRAQLAQEINDVLFAVTRDKHLRVEAITPQPPATVNSAPSPNRRDQPTTAGFKRVEILPDNIGVLELTMFLRPVEHRDAIADAMKTLEPAKALIIDMRANGGGSPGTVALLMSYFFEEPDLPLFDIIPREGDIDSYRTEPASVHLPRNGRRPIFVLTSSKSFSGGEGFAYLMQERKRAVIIGEKTAGAANPGRPYPVNDWFSVTIPNGHISSAIKHSNWEGDGVTPDVAVPAAQALDVAIERAVRLKPNPHKVKRSATR
jgi:retinol-binding protein 3